MNLLIVGASVRAAVRSAIEAGHDVQAYDLFADADTRESCERATGRSQHATIERIASFAQLIDIAAHGQAASDVASISNHPDRAIVCGGVENERDVMDAIAAWVPIAGCDHETVAQSNDWVELASVFHDAGCLIAETATRLPDDAVAGEWLRKPIAGSGGFGIRVARDADRVADSHALTHCFQKRVTGRSLSALFVGNGEDDASLVGLTEQLIGDSRLTDHPFAYCGSVGPVKIEDSPTAIVTKLGRRLVSAFRITGVFGMDFLLDSGGVYPVDVNPRIPASAELFERWDAVRGQPSGFNAVEAQLGRYQAEGRGEQVGGDTFGKAIVFNQSGEALTVDQRVSAWLHALRESDGDLADIPCLDAVVAPGEPIVTVFASADTLAAVETRLIELASQVRQCWTM